MPPRYGASVVELQQRHVAARVDGVVVVGAVFRHGQLVVVQVDPGQRDRQAGFAQGDMDGHRADAGSVVELHCDPVVVAWPPRHAAAVQAV
ncbi:hypothetical protein AU476_39375 [Cupriavidus sp. UYMSc13B]|nr:hypothetical protein AU476_39375 [Cupriavidus sp. UYMSc13B]